MKKVLILTVALLLVLSGMAFAGVAGSKHDLTQNTNAGSISDGTTSGQTTQVCVFCHHPHRTDVASGSAALLWNRQNTSQVKTYTTYQATILVTATGDDLGSDAGDAHYTRVCLSCHDGNVAANVVSTVPRGLTGTYVSDVNISGQANIAGDTDDLQNDHPVDFDYSLIAGTNSEFPAASGDDITVGSNTWKLFNGTMQCGTCHEPHTSDTSAGVQFIRNAVSGGNDPLDNSTMCSDCHSKH